jgi:hypothetical protein
MTSNLTSPGLLNKTITIKQLLTALAALLLVLTVAWYVTLLALRWREKMGGVTHLSSPWFSSIPETCKAFSRRSMGSTLQSTLEDDVFLRFRVHRWPLSTPQSPFGKTAECLGYAVLAGAHGDPAKDANFTEIFTDQTGEDVVEIRVRYFKNVTEVIPTRSTK